ncbi:MAG: tellurite resistance TerB family protein [gamma proteobacterium symbiont of Bathyaustriella thionipta]|nr:tellurite resistance TerB family protein [gamma proteobacterium symbiont of Bathyaustriella thionipta]
MNFTDILGSVLNQGITQSGQQRIDHSLGSQQGGIGDLLGSITGGNSGGLGDLLNSLGTGGRSGDWLGSLGKMASSAMNSGSGGGQNPLVVGGLGALAGALFGGGGGSVKGALGGTALAVLGSLAMKALSNNTVPDQQSQLMAGLRAPENTSEERQVQNVSELLVRAMLNAAKADGHVDEEEIRRILGKAAEDGLSQQEQDFIAAEMRKPMETEKIIQAVSSSQLAAQVYAASLLAIEVDTQAERQYLSKLAPALGLEQTVVKQLQQALGMN